MSAHEGSKRAEFAESVCVGERVILGDSDVEYVVVNVDHANGRLELLRLKPGRIEADIPVAAVRKRADAGPHLVSAGDD